MAAMTAISNIYSKMNAPPEQKDQLTRSFIRSVEVTCRSKIAKIVQIRNTRGPPF